MSLMYESKNVLVQCRANYRASTMTYLYRVYVEQLPGATAAKDPNAVWEPNEQWSKYMVGITSDSDILAAE